MEKISYIQAPLYLFRDLFANKDKTLNKILSYGIYNFAIKMNYDIKDVSNQLIYGYYNNLLTSELEQMTQSYINSGKIELSEYRGFVGKEFNPEFETENMQELFENDIIFEPLAVEFYQVKACMELLNLNINKNVIENIINTGKKTTIPTKEPMPVFKVKLLFDIRDNEKSEYELMQYAYFIAINSIIGSKSFARTNKNMVIARMFGYKSYDVMPILKGNFKKLADKYSTRYWFDKLKLEAQINWNVCTYSNYNRGFYISIDKKTNLEQLISYAETKKSKIQKLKEAKENAKIKYCQKNVGIHNNLVKFELLNMN